MIQTEHATDGNNAINVSEMNTVDHVTQNIKPIFKAIVVRNFSRTIFDFESLVLGKR